MPLHPQAEQFLELRRAARVPPLVELDPEAARDGFDRLIKLIGAGPAVAAVRDVEIPVGGASIGARIYEPADSNGATIIYLHGGGWVVGGLDSFDAVCRRMAVASNATVVSVDYRLAPEHPFPTGVDDTLAALRWVGTTFDTRGGLVVAGDSAGGNLAAVCALRARDADGPQIDLQVLIYPVTDHDLTRASYVEHGASHYPCGLAEMEWFWDLYVDPARRGDPDASPLRAPSLAGLPPALVLIAEFDPLRDEGLAYAERLEAEGVGVEVILFDDMLHGFFQMVNFMERADEAVDIVGDRVRALALTGSAGH
jgi:acetyl esterase